MRTHTGESNVVGKVVCNFCSRPGRSADRCWINSVNPHNRLLALKKGDKGPSEKIDSDDEPSSKSRSKKTKILKPNSEHRAVMARKDKEKASRPVS